MPRISLIMPAYKAEPFIRHAIDSVLKQTFTNFELLVVDDCSPDDTSGAALRAANGDPRVRVIRAAQNGGAPAARNIGITEANGEWIAAIDSDDAIEPQRLETLLQAAERNNLDIIADDLLLVPFTNLWSSGRPHVGFGTGEKLVPISLADWMERNKVLSGKPLLGYHKPLFRTAFLRTHQLRYNADLKVSDDYFFTAEALANGARMAMHPAAMYRYAVRPGSLSRSKDATRTYSQLLGVDMDFLRRHGPTMDSRARRAFHSAHESLLDAEAWEACVQAAREGRWLAGLARAFKRPRCLRHVGRPINRRISMLGRAFGFQPRLEVG